MRSWTANGDSRLLFWLRVREFAVPPSMIESATSRRAVGDWAGACAAARVDVDLNLRAEARTRGREFSAQVRADLRHLAPDLLRWHFPRIAPDGLLRPGLTVSLARYFPVWPGGGRPVHLVARTPPAWADAGQRISLALWDGSRIDSRADSACVHPHLRPDRRFRLDLHRHLWDARRADELRQRSGADRQSAAGDSTPDQDPAGLVPPGVGYAVDTWAAEAALLLRAEERADSAVTVRVGTGRRLVLNLGGQTDASEPPALSITEMLPEGCFSTLPILPDASTRALPDLELLRSGLIAADRLHPLVASALEPGHQPTGLPRSATSDGNPRIVECRGASHRIGLVDGVLVPLDHDPDQIRREELLAALGGTPLACLRMIDEAHRHPECLVDVRARLDHGDTAGALAVVEALLGPNAILRSGALRDELEAAAFRRITYGLFRTGLFRSRLAGSEQAWLDHAHRRQTRSHPRRATAH